MEATGWVICALIHRAAIREAFLETNVSMYTMSSGQCFSMSGMHRAYFTDEKTDKDGDRF